MMAGDSQENLEEERRLFYVAITRAEKRLFLSHTTNRFKWGQYVDCEPSSFLYELDEKYIVKTEASIKKQKKAQKQNYFNKYKKTKKEENKFTVPNGFKKTTNIQSKIIPSEINNIQNGMRVKHSKFGSGKILEISGENINKKATIFFEGVGQKQLLLRFAKLEIIKE
jgi:DNA helicase-2/ATP-dependent DNA helicase PcrA